MVLLHSLTRPDYLNMYTALEDITVDQQEDFTPKNESKPCLLGGIKSYFGFVFPIVY